MEFSAECWRLRPVGLAIVTGLFSACATVSSNPVTGICPPVAEYDAGFHARAIEEVLTLPDGSAIVTGVSIQNPLLCPGTLKKALVALFVYSYQPTTLSDSTLLTQPL